MLIGDITQTKKKPLVVQPQSSSTAPTSGLIGDITAKNTPTPVLSQQTIPESVKTAVDSLAPTLKPEEPKKTFWQKYSNFADRLSELSAEFDVGAVHTIGSTLGALQTLGEELITKPLGNAIDKAMGVTTKEDTSNIGEVVNNFADEMDKHTGVGEKTYLDNLAQGLGSTAPFLLAGVAGKAAQISLSALNAGMSTTEALVNAYDDYERLKDDGTKNAKMKALASFGGNLAINYVTNKLGFLGGSASYGIKDVVKNFVIDSLLETSQETAQQFVSNIVSWKPGSKIGEGLVETALVSLPISLVFGSAGVMNHSQEVKANKSITGAVNDLANTGATQEEITQVMATISGADPQNVTAKLAEIIGKDKKLGEKLEKNKTSKTTTGAQTTIAPTDEGLAKIAASVQAMPKVTGMGAIMQGEATGEGFERKREATPLNTFLTLKNAHEFKATPEQLDLKAEAIAAKSDLEKGAIVPEEYAANEKELGKKLEQSMTDEQKAIIQERMDRLQSKSYNTNYGNRRQHIRGSEERRGSDAGNGGVSGRFQRRRGYGYDDKMEGNTDNGGDKANDTIYSLTRGSRIPREIFPKVRRETLERIDYYRETYEEQFGDRFKKIEVLETFQGHRGFSAGIFFKKDGTFIFVIKKGEEASLTPEYVDHEFGHVWLSHATKEQRIAIQKSIQETYNKNTAKFSENIGLSRNNIWLYWKDTVRDIYEFTTRSLSGISRTQAMQITSDALHEAGLIDENGKPIIPSDMLDQAVFFNERTDAFKKALEARGYTMPDILESYNSRILQELVAFVAENHEAFANAEGELGAYANNVKKGTLLFGEENYTTAEQKRVRNEAPVYTGSKNLSLKTLEKLKGRRLVSKQFISDLTNSGDIQQGERDAIRMILERYEGVVPVKEFADTVIKELLPLTIREGKPYTSKRGINGRYEDVALQDNLRGSVKNYKENIYESPIKTSAGFIHFDGYRGGTPDNYFGHTRIEDIADDSTRRVIEVQSDLFQKGRLEEEGKAIYAGKSNEEIRAILAETNPKQTYSDTAIENLRTRAEETSQLAQYNNPTAHLRMVREEIKKAAEDGKTKLQFPTGETAMKIEGLGQGGDSRWFQKTGTGFGAFEKITPDTMKVGMTISDDTVAYGLDDAKSQWIITDVLGDGKFKAVPKSYVDNYKTVEQGIEQARKEGSRLEEFDISGKIDTSNPIYRFYEKDLGRYLKNRYDAKFVTDEQGVTWYEVPIKKEYADEPVFAFARLSDREPSPEEMAEEYRKIQNITDKYGRFPETYTDAMELTEEELTDIVTYLPIDVQFKIAGVEMELSPQQKAADELLDGKIKLSVPDIKEEALRVLGRGLYAHVFRKDAIYSLDEFADDNGFSDSYDALESIDDRYKERLAGRDQLRKEMKAIREKTKRDKIQAKNEDRMKKEMQKQLAAILKAIPTQKTTEGATTKKVIKKAISGEKIKVVTTEDILLKERLKNQARGAKAGFKAGYSVARERLIEKFSEKKLEVETIRKEVVAYIEEVVPVDKRGRFMTVVRDAQTIQDMVRAFFRVDNYAEKLKYDAGVTTLRQSIKDSLKSSKIDVQYKAKIEELISEFDLTTRRADTIEKLKATNEYLDTELAAGNEVYLPKQILKRLEILSKIPKGEITLSQIEGLQAELEILTQLGETRERTRQELYEIEKEKWTEKLKDEAITIESRKPVKRGIGETLSFKKKMIDRYKKAYNAISLKRLVLRPMDGVATITGMSSVKDSLDVSFSDYLTRNEDLIKKHTELIDRLDITEAQMERMGVYAIREQEGGYEKLENIGISREEADGITLTSSEQEYYDFVRTTFDSLFPEVKRFMRDTYNQDVGQVKNYVSFITDFDSMSDFEIYDRYGTLADDAMNRKNVEQGFTKERKGTGDQKIKINLEKIFLRHIDDVSYMLSMGKPIKMFSEIVKTPEIKDKLGDVGSHMWAQYLDLMARKGGIDGAKKIAGLDILRKNLGVAMMSFKLSSALVQLGSFADGAGTIGGDWMANGAARVVSSPEWRQFVMDNFPEVKNAVGDDIAFRELNDTWFGKAGQIGLYPLKKLDGLMRSTVAVGAYLKLSNQMGVSVDLKNPNKTILAMAQKLVRQSQGSSLYKDAPLALSKGMFTGNKSLDKVLFQFQSFLLSRWENIEEQIWRQGFKQKNYKKAVSGIMWLFIVAGALEFGLRKVSKALINWITGDDTEDSETWIHGTIRNALGSIPILGSLMNSIAYDSNPIPLVSTLEKGITGAKNIAQGKSSTTKEKGATDLFAGIGGLAGIPGSLQLSAILKNLVPSPRDEQAKADITKAYLAGDLEKANSLLDDAVAKGYIKQDNVKLFNNDLKKDKKFQEVFPDDPWAEKIKSAQSNYEKVVILQEARQELGLEEFKKLWENGRITVTLSSGHESPILISDDLKKLYLDAQSKS